MTLRMFTIRDIKGDAFGTPFFQATQGQALRAFADLATNADSTVGQHPEDFILYFLGTFDIITGDFTAEPHPQHLATGTDFIQNPNTVPLQRVS